MILIKINDYNIFKYKDEKNGFKMKYYMLQ